MKNCDEIVMLVARKKRRKFILELYKIAGKIVNTQQPIETGVNLISG